MKLWKNAQTSFETEIGNKLANPPPPLPITEEIYSNISTYQMNWSYSTNLEPDISSFLGDWGAVRMDIRENIDRFR